MKIEIINTPMLCWNDDESQAREYHVLAKVTECDSEYPYKVICNENTYPNAKRVGGMGEFLNAKPFPETIELTMATLNKLFGKTVKIIE